MLLKPFFCHLFQIGICLPDASARLVDMTDCLCIQALFYRRKQFIPKPIAAVFTLLVRRVLDPVLSLLPQPGLNLAPLRPEKRTDDAPPHRSNARKPGQTASAEQVKKNRFRIIIRMVGGGDVNPGGCRLFSPRILRCQIRIHLFLPRKRRLLIQAVPRLPSRLLDGTFPVKRLFRRIDTELIKRNFQPFTQHP